MKSGTCSRTSSTLSSFKTFLYCQPHENIFRIENGVLTFLMSSGDNEVVAAVVLSAGPSVDAVMDWVRTALAAGLASFLFLVRISGWLKMFVFSDGIGWDWRILVEEIQQNTLTWEFIAAIILDLNCKFGGGSTPVGSSFPSFPTCFALFSPSGGGSEWTETTKRESRRRRSRILVA